MNLTRFALLLSITTLALSASSQAIGNDKRATAAAQGVGQIQGTVVTFPEGRPLGNTKVTVYRTSPAPSVSGQVTTSKDGAFTIGSLPAGDYAICAMDTNRTMLDPCEWLTNLVIVEVRSGVPPKPVVVRVQQASTLHVQLLDPGGFLAQLATEDYPPHVEVLVIDDRGRLHSLQSNENSTGLDYQLRIPYNTPLHLKVQSKVMALEDTNHSPVANQGLIQRVIHESTKTTQPTFTFNVTGRHP